MKKQKIVLATYLLAIVLTILVLPMISAAINVTGIHADTNYTSITFNCSMNASGSYPMEVEQAHNASIWYSTDNTLATTLFEVIPNTTVNQTEFLSTISIEGLTDGLLYNFTCGINNNTDAFGSQLNATSVSSVGIDNTAPLCSVKGDHNTIPYKGTILIDWTDSDATTYVQNTSVTIDGPQDQTTMSYTDDTKALTLLSQDTKYWGDWLVTITATDNANNVCTNTYTFASYLPDGEVPEAYVPTTQKKDTGKIVLGFLAVAAIVYFAFIKKK